MTAKRMTSERYARLYTDKLRTLRRELADAAIDTYADKAHRHREKAATRTAE